MCFKRDTPAMKMNTHTRNVVMNSPLDQCSDSHANAQKTAIGKPIKATIKITCSSTIVASMGNS